MKLSKLVDKFTLKEVFDMSILYLRDHPYDNDDGTTEEDYVDEIKDIGKIFKLKLEP